MSENLLTTEEQSELAQAEKVISAGMRTFQEVGSALLKIRDERLYRASFQTFKSYLTQKWGMSQSRGYQLCDMAETYTEISTLVEVLPEAETHVRPLTVLDTPEQKAEAWNMACAKAAAENRPVVGRDVQESVATIKGLKAVQQPEPPKPTTVDTQWRAATGGNDMETVTLRNEQAAFEMFLSKVLKTLTKPESFKALAVNFEIAKRKCDAAANELKSQQLAA